MKSYKVLKFDVKNLNDRIYTKENIIPQIEHFNSKAKNYPIFGQIGYPETFNATIDVHQMSHKVHELYIEDDYLMAKIEILSTKAGKLLNDFIDNTVFRTRSAGTVDEDSDIVNIVEIFTIDAIDKEEDAFKGLID